MRLLLLLFATVTSQYVCSYYDTPGCTNISIPPCDMATKICYVHSNVCNSLRRILTAGYMGQGWRIHISSYSFACTQDNIAQCANKSAIENTAPLGTSPKFCIPINTNVNQPYVEIGTLGEQPAIIFTPYPSPTTLTCTVLAFAGPWIFLWNVVIDASNCYKNLPGSTIGISMSNSNLYLVDVSIVNAPVMIALNGTNCDNITLDFVTTGSNPIITPPFIQQIIIAAGACTNTVPISSVDTNTDFLVIVSSSATLVNSSMFTVFNFADFNKNYIFQPESQNCSANTPTCPKTTATWIYIIIPIAILVAIILIFSCSHVSNKIHASVIADLPMTKTK